MNLTISVIRKPFTGTVAHNVLDHGTGGINVDGTRIEGVPPPVPNPSFNTTGTIYGMKTGIGRNGSISQATGRFPANLILNEKAAVMLDEISGKSKSHDGPRGYGMGFSGGSSTDLIGRGHNDSGGASRFFYITDT